MPEHLLSGIKAIVAINMRKEGMLQREIADFLKMDRSIISHYLHGRYPSDKVMRVSEEIIRLPLEYGIPLITSLGDDKEITKKLVERIYKITIEIDMEKCIACGNCLECEYDAISVYSEDIGISIDKEKCVLCLQCVSECPVNALKITNYKV
ncbi:4Fe-4S ferredoxin iron-sulfur binding domain protein [Methanococcus vannielii SB]|jgi:4Fe-4S ferredoxin|uniref:4Fe-4S ferredoxin iron-sulfur binding domain protein n=1 Tax=Methanococcus vannielii (strain ATCC 35089 / DSM 1224 / JCM 13029 / OCM 148 / SB) TaxID=406327 RepID=A6UPP3_METVS|nr:4Fe-4S binding protein [Methanococcus vannielii]ABR54465.1 4Fe-4S ferredoxin iron-sulfur binding domain protein [Methanococcus vannielii SB]